MAKKKRPAAVDYAIYLLIRVVMCLVQALSWRGALALARGIAWLAHRVDRRHRSIATENVRLAFPELSDARVDQIVRQSYDHLAAMMIEMVRVPRTLRKSNIYTYVRHQSEDAKNVLLDYGALRQPKMVVTGHFGNWEVLSYGIGLVGIKAGIIARRLDNPYLDRFIGTFRRRHGHELLDKNDDYPRILQALVDGIGLGIVGDQDAGSKGQFVDFFGRPASTFKSIALLSLEYNAPILVLGAARVGHPLQYLIYFEDEIHPAEYAERPDAVRLITERYTRALERMIRRHPEQYFWLHRRWKSQPKARARQAA
jgi:KDO2-lipid IV(A) lauroyltransferase